jgi:two-component system, sensor histidine kinase FlrB
MLPSSHPVPMNALAPPIATSSELSDAFATFVLAADRLERSHSQLHDEVERLRTELEKRNRALTDALRENQGMRIALRQILDALPCGVVVLEVVNREIILANPTARHLLGLEGGTSLALAALPAGMRTIVERPELRGPDHDYEHEFSVEINGKQRWMTVRCTLMDEETAGRGRSQLILIVRETTSQKQAEQEREASRHLFALAEMVAVLAHEIRNPLGSLELLIGLLARDTDLNPDSRQYVTHLQAGVRSLSGTVNNVLRFHSFGEACLVPTELSLALRNAVEFVRPLVEQSGVMLHFTEALGTSEIASDCTGLQQVILNLTLNALRHTRPGGTITVTAGITKNENSPAAVIEFGDNGSGIRPEDLPHVFEPGFTTARQSAGLGLSVCQRIVSQHGGTISVSSSLGKGTTFRMEFPLL